VKFSLSWLADYVELPLGGALRTPESGHRWLAELTDEVRRKGFQIGERLTSVGLAVEAMAEPGAGAGGPDVVLDVEVTSNRPDCMSHIGIARELAVALDSPLRAPEVPFYGSLSSEGRDGAVVLEDPEGCPRLVSRVIRGVKVGPSPEWLRRRLEALGMRSINNVVDVTNFVLWETGQPLHAYDLATVPDGVLRVRRARAGETLRTLDGESRELDPEILVIADASRAIGLAGIMGGFDTEVTGKTRDVLLESAHFDRRRVRAGSRRLRLQTDASHRFERGTDAGACDHASRRCAALIVEVAGGEVVEPATDAVARVAPPVRWTLSTPALERFAGFPVADADVERILAGLGFSPRRVGAAAERNWEGEVPTWRAVDFEPRPADAGESAGAADPQDVYEEIVRHVGFDRVPSTLPAIGGPDAGSSAAHDLRVRVQDAFAGLGFAESIHFAFHDRDADRTMPALDRRGEPQALANPLSERYAVLRRSLVPNLRDAAEFNTHRGADAVRLFEVGRLFPGAEADELEAVAAVAGGGVGDPWDGRRATDLLSLKGDFEALFEELGAAGVAARSASFPGVVEGTGAEWLAPHGKVAGWFGQLAEADTPFELFAGEVLLDRLPVRLGASPVQPPPRLPGIVVDLTLTHSVAVSWAELEQAIRELPAEYRVGFRLKDRYRGEGVPEGAVATTISFEYNAGERSLTQDEVNERQAPVAAELERRFGVSREAAP
jgi:phenylalanyl-tRNA synthetase beta chain